MSISCTEEETMLKRIKAMTIPDEPAKAAFSTKKKEKFRGKQQLSNEKLETKKPSGDAGIKSDAQTTKEHPGQQTRKEPEMSTASYGATAIIPVQSTKSTSEHAKTVDTHLTQIMRKV